jgi:hypothetical protein
MDSSSYTITVGQGVTFTTRLIGNGATPTGTVNFKADGVSIAACSAVVAANSQATCTTSSLTEGARKITGVYSGDATYSNGIAGPITQTVNAAPAGTPVATPASVNVQGLWWRSQAESGWGVNLTHQGDTLFATWFTYDASGNGLWLVMSDGAKTGANTYSGTLYRTTGPAFNSATFNPSSVVRTPVGSATFSFTDGNNGTFTATVDGVVVSKPITRLSYASSMPTCELGGSAGAAPNYQDLWWRNGGAESGWGLNITHQGDTLFITWFTYGADGKGMWLSASNVVKTANGTYSGVLTRTTGPAFDSANFDPARVSRVTVGTMTLSFTDAANGVFTYTVDGVTQSKPITRLIYANPATVCR